MAEGSALKAMVAFFTIWRMDIDEDDMEAMNKKFHLVPILGAEDDMEAMNRKFHLVPFLGALFGIAVMVVSSIFVYLGYKGYFGSSMFGAAAILATVFVGSRFLHFDGLADFGDGSVVAGTQEDHVRALKDTLIGAGGLGVALLVTLLNFSVYSMAGDILAVIVFATVTEVFVKNAQVAAAAWGEPGHGMAGRQVSETTTTSLIVSTVISLILAAILAFVALIMTDTLIFDLNVVDVTGAYAAVVVGQLRSLLRGCVLRSGGRFELYLAHQGLEFPYRHSVADHEVAQAFLGLGIVHAEYRLGMSGAQQAHLDVVLHLGRQLEEPYGIGYGSPLLPHPVGQRVLGQGAFLDKALIAEGQFDRIEVLPLHVLDYGHFEHALVVGVAYVGGHRGEPGHAAGLVTALAADYLVAPVGDAAHRNGLDEPERAYRRCKFLERSLVERHSGLERVGLYHVHRYTQYVGRVLQGTSRPDDLLVHISYGLAELVCSRDIGEYGSHTLAQSSLYLAHSCSPLCSITSLARFR